MTGLFTRGRFWPRSLAGKAGVIALGCALVLVGAYLAALRYSSQRLAEAWKLSDEFGLSNDFVELLGPFVPPERNAAVPLDRAAKTAAMFLANGRTNPRSQDEPIDDPTFIAGFDGLLQDAKYEAALAAADRMTEYHSPVVVIRPLYSLSLAYLQTRRDLLRAERAVARRLLDLGRREEGVRRMLRVSRLTRKWEVKEPFLIAALVNIAIRTVIVDELNLMLRRGGPLPAALHDEIDRELAEYESILQAIPPIGQTEKIAAASDYEFFSPVGGNPMLRPLSDNDKAYIVRYLHRWMKSSDRPYYEVRAEFQALEDEIRGTAGDLFKRVLHVGAVQLVPAVNQARKAFDRIIAKGRCLRIVNAWARRGEFYASLDALGLPKECLIDPFDGQPLRVKPTSAGPIIYSVGDDLKDDGGKLDPVGAQGWDFGLGPPALEKK